MLRYLTAGESHGRGILAVLDGMVAGLPLSPKDVDRDLARRQKGYGRGGRMAIETDRAEILSGVRGGKTIGAPIALFIPNRDFRSEGSEAPVTSPRPGHADLVGALKYDMHDMRDILERTSARETAARVAAGAVCRAFLGRFGVQVVSWVEEIGGMSIRSASDPTNNPLRAWSLAEASELRCPDRAAETRMRGRIRTAMNAGDTLGGVFTIAALGVPPGLGSYAQWDLRLDGRLSRSLMSVQAIKAVEVGRGIQGSRDVGSRVHDEIVYAKKTFFRRSNNAGGLEGGVTNGEHVVLRAFMKPIPTLGRPLRSVDVVTKRPSRAQVVRHDVCAVPAASVVGEAAVAYELAAAFLEKFGGDTLTDTKRNYTSYLSRLRAF